MSYVTIDRFCQEKADAKEDVRRELERTGRPLRSSAGPLSDDELLAKLRLCDAIGISSIEEFDDRFPMTQSLFNWSQDLEMALENAGRDDGEMRQALIEFCEESLRRFPREDQLLTENRRRALGGAYFDAGMTEKAEELFRSWLDADPGWGWGWIGWADCYLPWGGRPTDLARAEKLLRRGYRVPGVRDRVYIAERLQEVCEDSGRPGEARQFGEQAGYPSQSPRRGRGPSSLPG
jgi:tetratricopeptide (TPR) repeat protein